MGIHVQKSINPTLLIDTKTPTGESRTAAFINCNIRENGMSLNVDIHDSEAVAADREAIAAQVMEFLNECMNEGAQRGFPVRSFILNE